MMTLHRLSAGDGYAYYTQEVASADELRRGGRELGDYYTVEGMPPGQWVGHSQELLGVSGEVTEAQMKALFGEGLHPEADARIAAGESVQDVQLGARYKRVSKPDTEFTRRLADELARYERLNHRPATGTDKREIRGRVGGQLFREMHGRDASSGQELGQFMSRQSRPKQQAVAGFDLVFAPSKSVSLLWALGGDEAREAVEAAHEDAIRHTLAYVENEALYTRRGRNGVRQIDVDGGLVATKFRHYDSRTGDPQLHDHVVVANKVRGADGKWSTIDSRTLHKMAVSASETYNARVIEQVCDRLGVSAVERSVGGSETVLEIDGISDDAIARASGRRASVTQRLEVLTAEFEERHGRAPDTKQRTQLAQQATLETRPKKKDARRLSDLVSQWQSEYRGDVGMPLGPDLLAHVRAAAQSRQSRPEVVDPEAVASSVVHVLSGKRSTWQVAHVRAEAIRQLARLRPGAQMPEQTVEQVVQAATQRHSLSMSAPRVLTPNLPEFTRADGTSQFVRAEAEVFTSQEVIDAEHDVLAAAQRVIVPQVSPAVFDQTAAAHVGPLSESQRELAREFTCGEHLFSVGIGPAGAGKTTSLRLMADAVRAADREVFAVAPTAAAASVMGAEIQAEATTLDAFLMDQKGRPGPSRLSPGDVVLVDEVGMVSTPQLAALLRQAQQTGAVVRGIGDDRQLAAVGAGGALRLVSHQVGATRLDEVHRFRTEGEAAASTALREPSGTAADDPWAWYIDHDRVVAGDEDVMLSAALRAWDEDTTAGKTALLVAADNPAVDELNRRAQALRAAHGQIDTTGPAATLRDGAQAWVGDRIVTRHNDRRRQVNQGKDFVKNGDEWEVTGVADDGAAVLRHASHGGTLALEPEYMAQHTQLAYASTVHRAQGSTVDTAHAVLTDRTDRAAAYVAVSRGRESNHVYLPLNEDQTRDDVLEAITAAYDRDLPAHEAVIEQTHATTSLAEMATMYDELDSTAFNQRMQATARQRLGTDEAAPLLDSDAWEAVVANLRTAQNHGLNAGTILEQSWRQHGLSDADDVGAVMAWRIEHRTDSAVEQIATGGHRPFSQVSDEFLDRALSRTPAAATPTLEDPEWGRRPFAWVKTDELRGRVDDWKNDSAEQEMPAAQRHRIQWQGQTMAAELERRAGLSPDQRAIEQMCRGDRPRSGHTLTLHNALANERRTRDLLAPVDDHQPQARGVSEDLAPTRHLEDDMVPDQHRHALAQLHARMELRAQTRGAELAENPPAWADALGPVPARADRREEWHRVAAETEAYRDRYNVPTHAPELIPARFTAPAADRLREQATALHKHSGLTTAAPVSAQQRSAAADAAAETERRAVGTSPAQAAVDRRRDDRAAETATPQSQRREQAAGMAERHSATRQGAADLLKEFTQQTTRSAPASTSPDAEPDSAAMLRELQQRRRTERQAQRPDDQPQPHRAPNRGPQR